MDDKWIKTIYQALFPQSTGYSKSSQITAYLHRLQQIFTGYTKSKQVTAKLEVLFVQQLGHVGQAAFLISLSSAFKHLHLILSNSCLCGFVSRHKKGILTFQVFCSKIQTKLLSPLKKCCGVKMAAGTFIVYSIYLRII